MPDPTKILAYVKLQRDNAKLVVAEAQQRLVTSLGIVSASSSDLASATSAVAELEEQVNQIRKRLATVQTKADGASLLEALEQAIVSARVQRANIVRAQEEMLAARAASEVAQTDMAISSAALAGAEAELVKATEASKQREEWIKRLGQTTLTKLSSDADSALQSKPFTDAEARINKDIPAALSKRARDRRAADATRIAARISDRQAAENAAMTAREVNGGPVAKANNQWINFSRAADAAQSYFTNARSQFDQAQATLVEVADASRFPLTPEQSARISDTALQASREAAATEQQALDAKCDDWENKKTALEAAILKAKAQNKDPNKEQSVKDARKDATDAETACKAADTLWREREIGRNLALEVVERLETALTFAIDKAVAAKKNPDTDADVIKARADLLQAQNDLKTADAAYKESTRGILRAWEAAVPDSTWRLFNDFEESKRVLEDLKKSDAAKLKTDLQTAESDYVKAQLAVDVAAAVVAQLDAETARRAAVESSALNTRGARLFSALRGDN